MRCPLLFGWRRGRTLQLNSFRIGGQVRFSSRAHCFIFSISAVLHDHFLMYLISGYLFGCSASTLHFHQPEEGWSLKKRKKTRAPKTTKAIAQCICLIAFAFAFACAVAAFALLCFACCDVARCGPCRAPPSRLPDSEHPNRRYHRGWAQKDVSKRLFLSSQIADARGDVLKKMCQKRHF